MWSAVVVFGAVLGLFVAGLVVTDRRDRERAREICGLIVVLDDAYRETPPATPVGQHVADEIHRYRLRLGC